MVTVEKFQPTNRMYFEQARVIRDKVFIQEQQVDARDEFDEYENDSFHFLLKVDNKPIGTARWRRVGDKIKLERFAVLVEMRGKKYGDELLNAVINDAKRLNLPLYLHAQLKAIPFYERRGFIKVGQQFSECDILHYKMELR